MDKRLMKLAGLLKEEDVTSSMQDFVNKNKEYKEYIDRRLGSIIFQHPDEIISQNEWETEGIDFVVNAMYDDLMYKARAFRPTGKLYKYFKGSQDEIKKALKKYIIDINRVPSWKTVVDTTAKVFKVTPEEIAGN